MSKGRISENTVNDIISSANIVDVISQKVELKKTGANYTGCCPFHNEKTPSFSVSTAKQIFKCFGCGEAGGTISFLMKHDNFTYPEALEWLAGFYNITIEYDDDYTPPTPEAIEEKDRQVKFMAATVEHYRKAITSDVKNYLEKRGFTTDDLLQWKIGYAPAGGKYISSLAVESGYFSIAEDLFICRSKGNFNYDILQERITFPLQDAKGKYIGISGRLIKDDKKQPKYINPTDTPLYHKDETWYGLNFAIKSIRKRGYANIVEGYTDVIAMHRRNITNTIASCGTAITTNQIRILKKYTNKVQLVMDGDSAGKRAALKYIDLFIDHGFIVMIRILPNKMDPDEMLKSLEIPVGYKLKFSLFLAEDGIQYKVDKMISAAKGFDQKAAVCEDIACLLAKVKNPVLREEYAAWIGKDHKDFKSQVTMLLKDKVLKTNRKEKDNVFSPKEHEKGKYTMPGKIKVKWEDVKGDILKYGMFTHQHKIYMRRGNADSGFTFKEVSNFSIQIIQHIEDEKKPLKLVSLQNIHNRKRTFDTPSEDFVTELGFKKMITGKGNFNWQGDPAANDFSRLTTKLYDDMGDGRMISVLGWQEEGFFVFNNVVIVDGRIEQLDQHGCFDYKGSSFYVPSGNHIYANNPTKYIPQKRAVFIESTKTFGEISTQMMKVHRNHAKNALLFTVASAFSDIIYDKVSFFPLLFLYGEPSSGKDNLIECCQSFFGKPQTPITITGKANTDKAKIRKFAQFRNMIGHMTEYSNGSDDTDQMMKSFWDRVGYERGTIDSAVGTESISIEMSVIFTGNDYPTNDALITRIITEEMNKTDFSDQEKEEYERLKEWVHDGISGLTAEILSFRKQFEENFRKEFKKVQMILRKELIDLQLPDRMISNASVLGAAYNITNKKLDYGFTFSQWVDHIKSCYKNQLNKMQTGSVISQFWDCFFEGVRSVFDTIEQHTEFDIVGDDIIINFSMTYPKYQKTHYNLFKKASLPKSVLLDKLKKSDAYKETISSHRYGTVKTSGYVFDIRKTGISDELLGYLAMKNEQLRANSPEPDPVKQEEIPFN